MSFIEETRDGIIIKSSLGVCAQPREASQGRPVFPGEEPAGCLETHVQTAGRPTEKGRPLWLSPSRGTELILQLL